MSRMRLVVLLVAIMILATGCIYGETTIEKAANLNFSEVTKLAFRDGTTGELITTEDTAKIQEFMDYLSDFRVKKSRNQNTTVGYAYSADFYHQDEVSFRITFVTPLNIDGNQYHILSRNLDQTVIRHFVLSLKP